MLCVYIQSNLEDITTQQLDEAIAALPEWRRTLALRFRHEQGKRECAFSYALLCRALREQTAYDFEREGMPRFEYGEHGKPTIVGHPELHFNISHCRHAVAVAVADSGVGIDVECCGRYKESVARYSMSDEELQRIASADCPDLEFTRLWTQKEALFKCIGTGIRDDIRHLLAGHESTHYIYIYDQISPDFVLSVANNEKILPKILLVGTKGITL